jgi:hypothetical protein
VARTKKDDVEAVLRKADATVDHWFRRGAGALRQQIDELQAGLKTLSANLQRMEKSRKSRPSSDGNQSAPPAPRKLTRSAAPRKAARPRRPKKAA